MFGMIASIFMHILFIALICVFIGIVALLTLIVCAEMARRNRQIRKRRQRWVWGSIAAVISLGTAALAWSYLPATKGSSSTSGSLAHEHDDGAK